MLNIKLYEKLQSGGLDFSSPAVSIGNEAINKVSQASQSLTTLIGKSGIDSTKLALAQNALNQVDSSLSKGVAHISDIASQSLSLGSLAKSVNKLDALASQAPSSCFNTEAIFSSVNGASDDLMNGLSNVSNELSTKISEHLAGTLSINQLNDYLGSVQGLVQSGIDGITAKIAAETDLIKGLRNKVQAMSWAQSIAAIWDDPCTRSILDKTLPADIKTFL